MSKLLFTTLLYSFINCAMPAHSQDCTPKKQTAAEYCSCADQLRTSSPTDGIRLASKGIELAEDGDKPLQLAECLLSASRNYIMLLHTDSASRVLNHALSIYQEHGSGEGLAQAYHLLGLNAYYQHKLYDAKVFYLKATRLQKELALDNDYAGTLNNLGLVSFSMHQYDTALSYFLQSLKIKERLGKKKSLASTLNNIGSVKAKMELHEDALKYFKKALKIDLLDGNDYGLAVDYCNISNEFGELGKYDSTIIYLKHAEKIFRDLKLADGLASVHNNLGASYLEHLNLPELAIRHYQMALNSFKTLASENDIYKVYASLARSFMKINEFKKAKAYLDSAASLEPEVTSQAAVYRYHLIASEYFEKTGQNGQALESYKKFVTLRDSLTFQEQETRQMELELAYESERKERELMLSRQNEKIAELKNQLFLGLIIASAIILMITVVYFVLRVKREKALRHTATELHEAQQHLMQEKYKTLKLEKEKMANDLEYKRQELTNQALFLIEKEQLFEDLKNDFQKLSRQLNNSNLKMAHEKLISNFKSRLNIKQDRANLREQAEPYLNDFYQKLEEQVPGITESEKRLASLLRSNLSSKEIATILNIEPKSVDMRRYRLRKKLNIGQEYNLTEFFRSL
ncbi:tetratricopeptide repeat protein [Fulvivirga kasyanovii]|uniref:Tetratricopeptide repeat protein n=1 Tax=Fulvivirga kasyanovii TaxID=396812 RepID=A0ABW9RML9_9BACT|nr:tetratricopeptide repeat protein [Fulvivirga kasyanovii]MTI25047.1 tetratricopeptide repeat protein [Fulvivirga kasyanovii]